MIEPDHPTLPITAMRVGRHRPLGVLRRSSGRERRDPRCDAGHGRAVHGDAMARLAADGSPSSAPRSCGRPQARPSADGAHGAGRCLPAAEDDGAPSTASGLALLRGLAIDRPGQVWCAGITVRRENRPPDGFPILLTPDAARLPLPCRRHGPVQPAGSRLAAVQR